MGLTARVLVHGSLPRTTSMARAWNEYDVPRFRVDVCGFGAVRVTGSGFQSDGAEVVGVDGGQ